MKSSVIQISKYFSLCKTRHGDRKSKRGLSDRERRMLTLGGSASPHDSFLSCHSFTLFCMSAGISCPCCCCCCPWCPRTLLICTKFAQSLSGLEVLDRLATPLEPLLSTDDYPFIFAPPFCSHFLPTLHMCK